MNALKFEPLNTQVAYFLSKYKEIAQKKIISKISLYSLKTLKIFLINNKKKKLKI